jgi:hypothetical protein
MSVLDSGRKCSQMGVRTLDFAFFPCIPCDFLPDGELPEKCV